MARSMWKGVISFGMVSIPVRLYIATESHSISFRQLCPEHNAPIKYKRWCSAGDHEVPYNEIVKGYEVGKDRYVLIDDQDLDNLPLKTAHTIEIQEFVPHDDIEGGLYYKSAYYLEPEEAGRKPYYLLMQALQETKRTAVAKIALRDREHLCSLQPNEDYILLNTLHWPDEIRSAQELPGLDGRVDVNPRELQMAKSLVETLADRFDPSRYQDDYREALMKVVEAKMEGQTIEAPEVEAEPRVMDLMEALKASVEAARKQKGEPEAESEAKPAKKSAARRKAS
jgi:DNA end-binding protein Ku